MTKFVIAFLFLAFGAFQGAIASDGAEEGLYAEFGISHYSGKSSGDSLSTASAYVEVPLKVGASLWGTLYHDKDFKGAYVGLSKQFGNWQVALGLGSAWYDDTRKNVINPWLFYSSAEYEALAHAERYLRDNEDPWFVKGYVQKKFNNFAIGVYGETDFGIGPMLTISLHKAIKVWIIVPVASRPNEGGAKFLIGLKYIYE